jgi:MFS family permease
MACLFAIQMNEALQINVLFPFLVFMIEMFGFTGPSLGVHAGLLASSFCGAQIFSSWLWGRLSDRVGLKPCLIAGTLGSSLIFFMFGLSTSFEQAVAARFCAGELNMTTHELRCLHLKLMLTSLRFFVQGLLNGNIGMIKVFVAKVTDETNKAAGFSFLSLAWGKNSCFLLLIALLFFEAPDMGLLSFTTGVGNCIAPVLGGLLSSPAETWPSTFSGTLFEAHPFFLPCACVGTWGLLASLALVFTLEEPANEQAATPVQPDSVCLEEADIDAPISKLPGSAATSAHQPKMPLSKKSKTRERNEETLPGRWRSRRLISVIPKVQTRFQRLVEDRRHINVPSSSVWRLRRDKNTKGWQPLSANDDQTEDENLTKPQDPTAPSFSKEVSRNDFELINNPDSCGKKSFGASSCEEEGDMEAKSEDAEFTLCTRTVLAACASYGLIAVTQQMLDEALPLFMKLSRDDGGLGFEESDIGALLAVGGIPIILSLAFVPWAERLIGAPGIFRVGVIGLTPIGTLFWMTGLAWPLLPVWGGWAMLGTVVFLKNVCLSFAFSGVFVMMSNSVPSERLGEVNGAGQTLASISRAAGPSLCGALWSLSTQLHFVPLSFIGIGVGCVSCLCHAACIPETLRFSYNSVAVAVPSENSENSMREDEVLSPIRIVEEV